MSDRWRGAAKFSAIKSQTVLLDQDRGASTAGCRRTRRGRWSSDYRLGTCR